MSVDFAIWLSSQSPAVQITTMITMAAVLVGCLIANKEIEKREYKRFVFDYYNGTLNTSDKVSFDK